MTEQGMSLMSFENGAAPEGGNNGAPPEGGDKLQFTTNPLMETSSGFSVTGTSYASNFSQSPEDNTPHNIQIREASTGESEPSGSEGGQKREGNEAAAKKKRNNCCNKRCCCIGFASFFILLALCITVVYISYEEITEIRICEINGCSEGANGTAACGQELSQQVKHNKELQLRVTAYLFNPNTLGVELSEWGLEVLWVGEHMEAAKSTLPTSTRTAVTNTIVNCVGERLIIPKGDGVYIPITCTVPVSPLIGKVIEHYYDGHDLELKEVIRARVEWIKPLPPIPIKLSIYETLSEIIAIGERMFLYDIEMEELRQLPLPGQGALVWDDDDPIFGETAQCPGSFDLPVQTPSLAVCGLEVEDYSLSTGTFTVSINFKIHSQLGVSVHVHQLMLEVYQTGGQERIGHGVTTTLQAIHQTGLSDITAIAVIEGHSELLAVLLGIMNDTPGTYIELDGIVVITVLGMMLSLNIPRFQIPLWEEPGGVEAEIPEHLQDMDAALNFLMGQCTCLVECDDPHTFVECGTENSGCFYDTSSFSMSCPNGYYEDVSCTSHGSLRDWEYCCPLNADRCSTLNAVGTPNGCYHLRESFEFRCPEEYYEVPECTIENTFDEYEFCCPKLHDHACAMTNSDGTPNGCHFLTGALDMSCPTGEVEKPECSRASPPFGEDEFCCPTSSEHVHGRDCSTENTDGTPNGCHFLTGDLDTCPDGEAEWRECSRETTSGREEFCCPNGACSTTNSEGAPNGCYFLTGDFDASCPDGEVEKTECSRPNPPFGEHEFCCPTPPDHACSTKHLDGSSNGCHFLTGDLDSSCPEGEYELTECSRENPPFGEHEFCCPSSPGSACSTENTDGTPNGCHFLTGALDMSCPEGEIELTECSRENFPFGEHEFCCPNPACSTTDSEGAPNGCYHVTDDEDHCPDDHLEIAECETDDNHFCCPTPPDHACSTKHLDGSSNGCYFLTGTLDSSCPAGEIELTECSRANPLFGEHEFCCPNPACSTTDSEGAPNGCHFLTGDLDMSCPDGEVEKTECSTPNPPFGEHEFCCPAGCSTTDAEGASNGCYFLTGNFDWSCPEGEIERTECKKANPPFGEHEFCCPNPACSTTDAEGAPNGCYFLTDDEDHCPGDHLEMTECNMEYDLCCPIPLDHACSMKHLDGSSNGCYFLTGTLDSSCPEGEIEKPECSREVTFGEHEFCCPDPTPSPPPPPHCQHPDCFLQDAFGVVSCPDGYYEVEACNQDGDWLQEYEYCCPE